MKTYNLKDFEGAIWFEDPTKYDYVRMNPAISLSLIFKGRLKGTKCIGYTKPKKTGKIYKKYIFWLKDYDRGMPKEKLVYGDPNLKKRFGKAWKLYRPCEAVKIIKNETKLPVKSKKSKRYK